MVVGVDCAGMDRAAGWIAGPGGGEMKWNDGRGPLPPAGIHPKPWRPSGATIHNRTLETRTALYRFYAGNDRLLYIGITVDPVTRFAQHAQTSAWYRQHARVVVEWFDTRTAAELAERAAIATEKPLWNVTHAAPGCGPERRLAPYAERVRQVRYGQIRTRFTPESDVRRLINWDQDSSSA